MLLSRLALLGLWGSSASSQTLAAPRCKCLPGDKCWPSPAEWNALNHTVGGRLIATVPIASSCHDPTFNAAACKVLQDRWMIDETHYPTSSSPMMPFFANQSCDPFQPRERPCEFGNYVRYAVRATGPADIQATIAFAKKKNIRLVIRNTGHDFLGRSTGAGALAVWTHHLKNINFIDNWHDATYSGSAVKIGAGVQGFEILTATRDKGKVVVGGECATVGIAGGYTQGAGHSALSSNFGLSADNVLNWEVVTAAGKFVNANKAENSDLYWALRGGGGGNYGVVVSMTVKTYPDVKFGSASVYIPLEGNSPDAFSSGVQAFFDALPALVDANTTAVFFLRQDGLRVGPITGYNKTEAEVKGLVKPLISKLESRSVVHTAAYAQFSNYWNHYNASFGPLPIGAFPVADSQLAGRLIPRAAISKFTPTYLRVLKEGATAFGIALNVKRFGSPETVAAHPVWRDTIVHYVPLTVWDYSAPWEKMVAVQDKLTNEIMPMIEAATPGGGAYVNEANFRQPNFQKTFWGSNYQRLLQVKEKWDPERFFYATAAVGSEAWTVSNDGRMCSTSK